MSAKGVGNPRPLEWPRRGDWPETDRPGRTPGGRAVDRAARPKEHRPKHTWSLEKKEKGGRMPRPRQGDILGSRVGEEAELERDGSGGRGGHSWAYLGLVQGYSIECL